jgi:hypothetical protein
MLVPSGATHAHLVEAPSHVYCQQVLHMVALMGMPSCACCYRIEGGAIVTGGEAVWNISVSRHLLQQ